MSPQRALYAERLQHAAQQLFHAPTPYLERVRLVAQLFHGTAQGRRNLWRLCQAVLKKHDFHDRHEVVPEEDFWSVVDSHRERFGVHRVGTVVCLMSKFPEPSHPWLRRIEK